MNLVNILFLIFYAQTYVYRIREKYLRITHIHIHALKQWYMNWIIVVEKNMNLSLILLFIHIHEEHRQI